MSCSKFKCPTFSISCFCCNSKDDADEVENTDSFVGITGPISTTNTSLSSTLPAIESMQLSNTSANNSFDTNCGEINQAPMSRSNVNPLSLPSQQRALDTPPLMRQPNTVTNTHTTDTKVSGESTHRKLRRSSSNSYRFLSPVQLSTPPLAAYTLTSLIADSDSGYSINPLVKNNSNLHAIKRKNTDSADSADSALTTSASSSGRKFPYNVQFQRDSGESGDSNPWYEEISSGWSSDWRGPSGSSETDCDKYITGWSSDWRGPSGSSETDCGKYITVKDKNGTNTKYFYNETIGAGQFGTVYAGYRENETDAKYAIKITYAKKSRKGDVSQEYWLSRKLARKQQNYNNGKLDNINIVHIVGVQSRIRKHGMIEYFMVMRRYPGSLRDLMDKQLAINANNEEESSSQSTRIEMQEVYALRLTINILKQCVAALKQLQALVYDLQYNDWSPNNILLNNVDLPVSSDIVCKLSDFGKAREGKHKFGTGPYVSNVENTTSLETHDMNSIAVVGIELLSVFGSEDNAIWKSINAGIRNTMHPHGVPIFRDKIIETILSDIELGEVAFHSKTVTMFFIQLAKLVSNKNANFEMFEALLDNDMHVD